MNAKSVRSRNGFPFTFAVGLMGVASYGGCMPDFDALSVEFASGNGGTGADSGGTGASDGAGEGGSAAFAAFAAVSATGATSASGGDTGAVGASSGVGGSPGGRSGSGGKGSGGKASGGKGSGGQMSGDAGMSDGGEPIGGTGATGATAGSSGTAGDGGEGGVPVCDPGMITCPNGPVCGTDVLLGNAVGHTFENCGDCGVTCSTVQSTSAACTSGTCVPTCTPGYMDCSQAANDGCEIFLDALANCATDCAGGTPCATDQVCNAGVCMAAQGVVEFSVPFTTTNQDQRYADRFLANPNLTNQKIFVRVYAPGATNGSLFTYPTDASSNTAGPGVTVPLATLAAGWTDITIPLGGALGDFDPSTMWQITFEVLSGNAAPWTNPTLLYIDRIWTSDLQINDTFDANIGNMIPSTIQTVPGSTHTWLDAVPPPPDGSGGAPP